MVWAMGAGSQMAHDTAFFHQVGVYIHLADIVHDDGEFDSFLIGKDAVQKGGLSASQVTGQKKDRDVFTLQFDFHISQYWSAKIAKISP